MAQWHKDKAKHFIIELRKESLVKSFIRFVLVSRERLKTLRVKIKLIVNR